MEKFYNSIFRLLTITVLCISLSSSAFGQCFDEGDIALTFSPPSNNGIYPFDTEVEMCVTITGFQQVGIDWLHSAILQFGDAWDISTISVISMPTNCGGAGTWGFYNATQLSAPIPSVTTTGVGSLACIDVASVGGGFVFDYTSATTIWGDSGGGTGANCPQFCWTISTINVADFNGTNTDLSVNVLAMSDNGPPYGLGTWTSGAGGCDCDDDEATQDFEDPSYDPNDPNDTNGPAPALAPCSLPQAPVIDGPNLVCSQDVTQFAVTNEEAGVTYTWFDSAGNQVDTGPVIDVNWDLVAPGDLCLQYINADCANVGIDFFQTCYAVSVLPAPDVSLVSPAEPIALCPGETATLTGATALGGPNDIEIAFTGSGGSIPDNDNAGLSSTVTVSGVDAPAITATVDEIVSVCLDIDHPNVGDLVIELISPSGTAITLVANEGGTGDDFEGTCFVPTTGATPITAGVAPFNGEYGPEFPYFLLTGSATNGDWTLNVVDDGAGAVGMLNYWEMTFNTTYDLDQSTLVWTTADGIITGPTDQLTTTVDGPGTYTLSITDELGCVGFYEVVVNSGAGAAINLSLDPTACTNDPANPIASADQPGGVYTINAPGVINATTGEIDLALTPAGIYTVEYEITNASCSSTANANITISNEPVVSINGLLSNYCNDEGIIALEANPIGGTFTINNVSATELDLSNYTSNTLVTVDYTIVDQNGCPGAASQTVDIAVQEVADFTLPSTNVCEQDGNIIPVLGAGFTPGGIWSGPPGLVINPVTGEVDVASSVPGTSYAITYTTPGAVCNDAVTQFLGINEIQVADFILDQTACINGDSIVPILDPNFTIDGEWTADFGVAIDDSSGTIDLTQSTVGGPYTITYTTPGPFCVSTSTQSISFTGLEDATFSVDADACQTFGTVTPVLDPAAAPGGTWTADFGLDIDPITGQINTNGSTIGGPYALTYTSPSVDCGNTFTQFIEITPVDDASFTFQTEACEGDILIAGPFVTGLPGGTFTMDQGAVIDPVTGLFDLSTLTPGVTYNITYTTPGAYCNGQSTAPFTYNGLPNLSIDGLDSNYCEDNGLVSLAASPAGGSFTIDAIPGSSFDTNNYSAGDVLDIVYTYTDATSNCTNTTDQTVTIDALPVLSIDNLPSTICSTASTFNLEGTPAGGVYEVDGNTTGTFDPSLFSEGDIIDVVYTYTDATTNCSNSITQLIEFDALPVVSIDNEDAYCIDEGVILLEASPAGGEFTINGNVVTEINTGDYSAGDLVSVTYTLDDGSECIGVTSEDIAIDDLPTLSIDNNLIFCEDAAVETLTASPAGGTFTINNVTVTEFDPSSLAGGGTIDVTYTFMDSNNCENSITETLNVNALPQPTFTSLDAAYCVTSALVVLDANPSGGTFTINGMNATELDPTSYSANTTLDVEYTFTDINNCTAVIQQDVNIDDAPQIQTGLEAGYCNDDGQIDLVGNPSGGDFTLDGSAATDFDTNNYTPGDMIEVIYTWDDGQGCSNTVTEQIEIFDIPSATIDTDDNFCEDFGLVNLTASPGGGDFTINGIAAADFNTTDYAPGDVLDVVYLIEDNNECTFEIQQDIVINGLPTVSIDNVDGAYCITSATVSLEATPAGGEFTINGTTVTELVPGDYPAGSVLDVEYVFTDGNNCESSATLQVNIDDAPALASNLNTEYCNNDALVTLEGNPAGGEFTIGGIVVTEFDPTSFSGATSVDVVYSYDDGAGCSNVLTETITLNPEPNGSFTIDEVFCNSDPVVVLGATPAGGDFTVNNTPATEIDPSDFDTYIYLDVNYTYTDPSTNCTTSYNTPVEIYPVPEPSFINLASAYCDGASTITLTADPPGGDFLVDGSAATELIPSDYSIGTSVMVEYTIEDGNGCSATIEQEVGIENNASASIDNAPTEMCSYDAAITLTASPAGGTFSGSGVIGDTFDPNTVTAGQSYAITYDYIDPDGCGAQDIVNIQVNEIDDASFSFDQASYCISAANPMPDNITLPGGTFSADNGLQIDAATGEITISSGAIGEMYEITYTTDGDCPESSTYSISISESDNTNFSYSSTSFCLGSDDPVPLSVGTVGGTFDSADVPVDPVTGEVDLSAAQIGDVYNISYSTTGACASTTTIAIEVDAGDDASFALNQTTFCPDDAVDPSALQIATPGGVFAVDGGLNVNPITGQVDLSGAVGGSTYTLTYTTIGACPSSSQLTFDVLEVPEIALFANEGICLGEEIEVNLDMLSGNMSDFNSSDFVWDFDNAAESTGAGEGPYSLVWDQSGIYTISVIMINQQCSVEPATTDIIVEDLQVFTIEDVSINFGEQISVTTTASGSQPTYSWTPSIGLSCTDCPSPVAQPTEDVTYTVEVFDSVTGCSASTEVSLSVAFVPPFIPNAFTPDNDGLNDAIGVLGEGLSEMNLVIYNRWGERIFETNDPSEKWDGTYKGIHLDPDVFVYVLSYSYLNNEKGFLKGNITLIR